jgi:hypothetical protein
MKQLPMFIICGAALLAACSTSMTVPGDCVSITLGDQTLSPDMLVRQTGVAEAEAESMRDGVPFGERNAEWLQLKNMIKPGDEVWFYRDNHTMAGAEGYLLLRDCDVVAFVMTTKY